MFALLKHQFLGNSRWYAKRSLSSVLRLGHQHTLLTVTHTADANTVADYPTFARLLPNRKSRSLAPRLPPASGLWPRAGRKQVIQKSSSTLYRAWAFFPAICRRYASRLALPKSNATRHPPPPPWLFGFASTYFLPPCIDRSVPIIRAASFNSLFFLRGLSACAGSSIGRLNFAAANNGSGIIQNTVTFPPTRSGGYKFDPNGL